MVTEGRIFDFPEEVDEGFIISSRTCVVTCVFASGTELWLIDGCVLWRVGHFN